MREDESSRPENGVRRALEAYAATYLEVVRIAADGGSEDEIADLASGCYAAAAGIPLAVAEAAAAAALLRELYESLLVLSGVQRTADTLSLPVATCVNGKSLRPFLVAYRAATGDGLEPPAIPESLVRRDVRDSSPTSFLRWPRRRLAANVDRGADRATRPADLTRVFAERLAEALGAYETGGDATAPARRFAPLLIGFARLADRGQAGLRPPEGATALARVVVDGLVGLADGRQRVGGDEIERAAAPVREWLSG
ncbi:MAG: hypothetical protein ABI317_14960 [Gaiellales bacterium]